MQQRVGEHMRSGMCFACAVQRYNNQSSNSATTHNCPTCLTCGNSSGDDYKNNNENSCYCCCCYYYHDHDHDYSATTNNHHNTNTATNVNNHQPKENNRNDN